VSRRWFGHRGSRRFEARGSQFACEANGLHGARRQRAQGAICSRLVSASGRIRLPAVASLLALIVACGSPFTTSNGPPDAQACSDLAHNECSRLGSCSLTVLQIRYGDEATCEAQVNAACTVQLTAPSTGNSPAHEEGCSQAYSTLACTADLNIAPVPAACQQQTGSIPNGGVCVFMGQCESGFCAIVPGAPCGVCAPGPALGDSCKALTTCGLGLFCTTDTQTCASYVELGGACGKGLPCGTGLACIGASSTSGKTGTCMTAATAAGMACDPTNAVGPGCDRNSGLVCNTQSKQCAQIAIVPGGQACGLVNSQDALCSGGGLCMGAMGTTPGTCLAAPLDGASCDLANGPPCLTPLRCIVGSDGGTTGTCHIGDPSVCR
jgi:hypothetical protein